ncbi:MAG: hypothetical protein ACI9MR_003923 [Myxococcota bacterium]|jgi:hypothetical protein
MVVAHNTVATADRSAWSEDQNTERHLAIGERINTSRRSGGSNTRVNAAVCSLTVCLLVSLFAGCGEAKWHVGEPSAQEHGLGNAHLALGLPTATGFDRIDYTLTFTYLDATPPIVYNTETYTSVRQRGELISILPCWTRPDGEGLNQVDVTAVVYFTADGEPVTGTASTVFVCKRNADAPVNLLLSVIGQLDAGFVDIAVAPTGTLCASKVDFKDDGFLGVCPSSSCGDARSLFVFANTCQSARGDAPRFWLCGDPTDWVMQGTLAQSLFPVPLADGEWHFGVVALDHFQMAQRDLTLTDEDKFLKVWAGISASFAAVARVDGETEDGRIERRVFDFAAELNVPPLNPGEPSPTLLLLLENSAIGTFVTQLERFGACDQPAVGVSLLANYDVVDVRREGDSVARLLLRGRDSSWITAVSRCEAGWSADQKPVITCQPPTSIVAEAPAP